MPTGFTCPYSDDGDERHLLDIYLPEEPDGRPFVLVIHGGGLVSLSKERMAGVSLRLAAAGFGAATPNYRLIPQAPYPAQLEDCLRALEWARARPAALRGLNVERAGVLGASAGAFLGQMIAARLGREQVACLVSVSGPSDVQRERADGSSDSPLGLVSSRFPPTLITHSLNDQVVGVEHARRLAEALERAGVPHEFFIYERPEEDHGIWVPGTAPPVLLGFLERRVVSFLAKWLCGSPE